MHSIKSNITLSIKRIPCPLYLEKIIAKIKERANIILNMRRQIMNILVMGGAGFLGTHLSHRLKEKGHNVIIIDLKGKFKQIHTDLFSCYECDIRKYEEFDKIKKEQDSINVIYHLAAQTSGRISQEEPELDVDTNVKGTLNVCRFAKEKKVKKIIFTSSMATYGNYNDEILESFVQRPVSNYGISKVCGEQYIRAYNQYDMNYTIYRLFNLFGPGQNLANLKQGMASVFMTQSILSNNIKVTGSLDRYRDFIHVEDVVEALILGLSSNTDNEVYNVGSSKKVTVSQLIDSILEVNDKESSDFIIENIGSHEGDQFGSIANIDKIRKLGWYPKKDFITGLREMYEDAKKELNKE